MCVDASQSTSQFSLMDYPEQAVWNKFASEVLKLDVRKWLHQDEETCNIRKHGVG